MTTEAALREFAKTVLVKGRQLRLMTLVSPVLLALSALAAPNGVSTTEGYEITVADGTDVTLNSDDITALGTSTALIKKGGGRLIIATNMSAWQGNFGISNGYVRLSENYADGKQGAGTLRLEPGATIELGGTGVAANRTMLRRKNIYIGGMGVGGAGAVYAIGNSQNQILYGQTLRLTADTLFKCSPTVGPRACSIYFDGHKLTTDGGTLELCGDNVYGPGEIYAINNCKVWMENGTPGTFNKKASGYVWKENDRSLIRLASGSSIQQSPQKVNSATRCEWDIACEGNASFISNPSSSGPWTGFYGFYGPISSVAGGTLTFDVRDHSSGIICPLNVTNVVSGGGDILVKCGASVPAGTLNLSNPNSTISGSLTIQDGVTVNAASPLCGVIDGNFAAKSGALNIDLSSTNLDDNAIYTMWEGVNSELAKPTKGNRFFKFNYELGKDYTFSKALTEPLVVYHGGTNAMTLASSANGMQNYINEGGDLILKGASGDAMNVGWIDVRGGTVTIPSGTYAATASTNSVYVGADYPAVARFAVKGTYKAATNKDSDAGIYFARNFSDASDTRRGIVELFEGGCITNRLDGGSSASGVATHDLSYYGWQGSYFQHGGEFVSLAGNQYFGSYQNMYARIEGGRFVNNSSNCRLGRRAGVVSFLDITGGRFHTAYEIGVGQAGAQGTICVSGNGSYYAATVQSLPRRDGEAKTGGSHAIFAVDGPNATAEVASVGAHGFYLAGQYNSIGEIDLNNGGTLSANGAGKVLTYVGSGGGELTGNSVVIAFNGGVFRTAYDYNGGSTKDRIFRNFTQGVDHVRIYAGGATIDTDGRNLKVGTPLEAPSGNGVESIPLPAAIAALDAWEYIAAPAVTITDPDGTGSGATAVAIYNTTTGKVTGFRVLNRGNNYTSAQATISKGGYTNTFTVACTLSANASGGLTKKGAGKLVLDCANTYTGATVVAGGTLVSSNAAALTSTCALRLEGGTLDLTTQDITDLSAVDEVVLAGGTIVNDAGHVTLPDGKCSLDLAAAKEGRATAVTSAMALPASFNLLNGDLAEKADRKYTLLTLPEGYSGPIPAVTGLPAPWIISVKGRAVRMVWPSFTVVLR